MIEMREMLEIATHPNDLMIIVSKAKGHPGKWMVGFFRGKSREYKPLLTGGHEKTLVDSKAKAIGMVRFILIWSSVETLYEGSASKNCDEFVEIMKKAGFGRKHFKAGGLKRIYQKLSKRGSLPILAHMIDTSRVLNAAMIDEIIERLKKKDSVDTSLEPLKSFAGNPTY